MIEVVNHEALMNKLKFDMEMHFDNLLSEERCSYERKLTEERKRFESEKQVVMHILLYIIVYYLLFMKYLK